MQLVQQITPGLWFDDQAEDAVAFYTAIFPNSRTVSVARYGEAGREIHGKPAGSVMAIAFELDGQPFAALNGGPQFQFNEAISFQLHCASQAEVDYYWEKLSAGGDPRAQACGWLKDRYGVSWQVVPAAFFKLLQDPDAEKVRRATEAMFGMKKLDLAELERAFAG